MAAEIRTFTCLNDNFGYLIHDVETKATASIDAPEAGPIVKALEREGWQLTDILITHHHGDHVGGVAELKQKYNCRVVAPHDKTTKIADVDLRVANADIVKVGSLLARVLETPGHTLDHISYCVRHRQGAVRRRHAVLDRLRPRVRRQLSDDVGLAAEAARPARRLQALLRPRIHRVQRQVRADRRPGQCRAASARRGGRALRAENKPTIPSLLGDEKKANVFLRADEPSVAASLHMKGATPPRCSANCANARTNPDDAAADRRRHHRAARAQAASRGRPLSRDVPRRAPDADGRPRSTAIYFLLARGERSHWHRVDAVEVWHYYAGAPLMLEIAAMTAPIERRHARARPRGRRAAAGVVPARRLAGGRKPRRLDAGRLHGRAGLRVRGLRAGAEGLGAGR